MSSPAALSLRRTWPKGLAGVLPATLFLGLFFVAPLIDNTLNSLETAQGWSIDYYLRLLSDPYFLTVIFRTLWVSFLATVICVVVGYPIAWFLVRHSGRWSTLLIFLLVAPLMTSILMRTYGWQVLLARGGMVNSVLMQIGLIDKPLRVMQSPASVMIGLVHILVPYMVISIAAVLQSLDRRYEEAANILGAGRLRTFLRISLPLSLSGVVTGSIICFMMANGSFLTMILLGNNTVVTLPVLIYQQFTIVGDARFSAAMGNVLLVLALLCLTLQLWLVRPKKGAKT